MTDLFNFNIYGNQVNLQFTNGERLTVYLNNYSGKVYYRLKIKTISKVRHTGIYLGQDSYGINYFMHNHYLTKKPSIVSELEFSKGMDIFEIDAECANLPQQIIFSALNAVLRGERYDFINYNCQTFTSSACNNIRHSPDVEKWKGIAVLFVVAFGIAAIAGK